MTLFWTSLSANQAGSVSTDRQRFWLAVGEFCMTVSSKLEMMRSQAKSILYVESESLFKHCITTRTKWITAIVEAPTIDSASLPLIVFVGLHFIMCSLSSDPRAATDESICMCNIHNMMRVAIFPQNQMALNKDALLLYQATFQQNHESGLAQFPSKGSTLMHS